MRRKSKKKRRKYWINPILKKRTRLGEFHHLHRELERDPNKFFDYYRMSPHTYLYILNSIKPVISKESNFRETIQPDERLSVTLR